MKKQILVLKTSLVSRLDVEKAGKLFDRLSQIIEWNIDLEDCDRVLRIECIGLTEEHIAILLRRIGYKAEKLY